MPVSARNDGEDEQAEPEESDQCDDTEGRPQDAPNRYSLIHCQAVMCLTAHMTASSILVLASEISRLLPIPEIMS